MNKSTSLVLSSILISTISCSSNDSPSPEIDTAIYEKEVLGKAKEYYDREMYSLARETWQDLRNKVPTSHFIPLAEIKVADSHFFGRDYTEAIVAYEDFIKLRPMHEATPYAAYQIAESNFLQYKGPEHDQDPLYNAIEQFERIISSYSHSYLVESAKKRIRTANELLAQHEVFVASFYIEQGMQDAALSRVKTLFTKFATTETTQREHEKLLAAFKEQENFDQAVLEELEIPSRTVEEQEKQYDHPSISPDGMKYLQQLGYMTSK